MVRGGLPVTLLLVLVIVVSGCTAPQDENSAVADPTAEGESDRAAGLALDADVRRTVEGRTTSYPGDSRFYPDHARIEIDYVPDGRPYDILIEKAWVDEHVPFPGLRGNVWHVIQHDAREWYSVSVAPDDASGVLVLETFYPTEVATYTRGNPANIQVWAFNESQRREQPPLILRLHTGAGLLLTVNGPSGMKAVALNMTFLADRGITHPTAYDVVEERSVFSRVDFQGTHLVIPEMKAPVLIEGNSPVVVRESRVLMGVVAYDNVTGGFDVAVPLYVGYVPFGFMVQLLGVPWEDPGLAGVDLIADGSVADGRNRTHYRDGRFVAEPGTVLSAPGTMAMADRFALRFLGPDGNATRVFELGPIGTSFFVDDPVDAGLVHQSSEAACRTDVTRDLRPSGFLNSTIQTNGHDWAGSAWEDVALVSNSCDAANETPERLASSAAFSVWGRTRIIGNGSESWFANMAFHGASTVFERGKEHASTVVRMPSMLMMDPVLKEGNATAHMEASSGAELRLPGCPLPGNAVSTSLFPTVLELVPSTSGHVLSSDACRSMGTHVRSVKTSESSESAYGRTWPEFSAGATIPMSMALTGVIEGQESAHQFETGWLLITNVNSAHRACALAETCAPWSEANVVTLRVAGATFEFSTNL